jgi:hypothetical protein
MLTLEQKVNGILIAVCKIKRMSSVNAVKNEYTVVYLTTEHHKEFPKREVSFNLNHNYSEGMEVLIKKVYEQLPNYLTKL